MKTSELMRIVAKNVLAGGLGKSDYICREIENVVHDSFLLFFRYGSAIKRVNCYIQGMGTFTIWLDRVTKKASNGSCNSYNHEPQNHHMVQFLRSMLCETIAKEFEAKGD